MGNRKLGFEVHENGKGNVQRYVHGSEGQRIFSGMKDARNCLTAQKSREMDD